ncbi:MAG: hypothetical protein AKCLJLPJ_02063 [Fimbriimonadales bacterium]|nr:hypothetical protein [Fimbriimonadales bacterium]
MKLRILLVALATALLGGRVVGQPDLSFDPYPYRILKFHVKMAIHEDGEIAVTESITVRFNQSRRGIFRNIPVEYPTKTGTVRKIFLTVESVTDEYGNALTHLDTREGENLNIRIGDEDVYLPPGTVLTYVIQYSVFGALNWFDDDTTWEPYAELYWNATGDQWDTVIDEATAEVEFPAAKDATHVRLRVYVGPYGSTLNDTAIGPVEGQPGRQTSTMLSVAKSSVAVHRFDPLDPAEGMTIVLNIPADSVAKPTWTQWLMLMLLPNLGLLIPLPVLLFTLIVWLRYGRDPDSGPMVVHYEPPDGITGPEAGALLDETVDRRDVVAGIISLAVKGYLEIEVGEETGLIWKNRPFSLRRTGKALGTDLTDFETDLLSKIGGSEGDLISETNLKTRVGGNYQSLTNSLYRSLVKRRYYIRSPQEARGLWIAAGVGLIVLLGVIATVLSPYKEPFPAIIGGAVGVVIVIAFARIMPRRTKSGAKAHAAVRGFEEFIRRAESQELEWKSERQPDALMFEQFLPHAVAFGLVEQWARAFQGILVEPPRWYHDPYQSQFNALYFSNALSSATRDFSSAVTPPRSSGASGGSSGFGGGGFSGGGFGGGGGGSW